MDVSLTFPALSTKCAFGLKRFDVFIHARGVQDGAKVVGFVFVLRLQPVSRRVGDETVNGQVINLPTANIPCVHDASAKVRPAGVVEQLVNARRRLGSEFALPVEIVQQLFLRFAVLPPDGICLFQPACQARFALADGIIGGEKFAAREGQDDEGELTPAEGEHVIGEKGGEQKLCFHAPLQPNAFPRRFRLRFNLRVGLQLRSPSVYHQRLQGSDEPEAAWINRCAIEDVFKIRASSQRLKARLGGVAVAKIEGNLCGACRVAITAEIVRALRDPEGLPTCENCGRFLFGEV